MDEVRKQINEVLHLQSTIDFEKANAERQKAIEELISVVTEVEDMQNLVLASKDYAESSEKAKGKSRHSGINPDQVNADVKFHNFLCELIDRYQLEWNSYKNLKEYNKYITLVKKVTLI